MDADVYHILDRLHYLSYFLGLARYDRFRDKNGTYKYTIGKKNCFFRAANVILMIIGSYLAIVEITRDEISDFDVVTLIYMFTEPTITGIIIIDNFTRKQKQFLQSAELLHEVDEEFFKLGLKRTIPVVKWMITYYLNAIVFGNFAYNVLSYVGGKTMIHSIYEYLSYGISFHAQNTIICYYNTFTTIIIQDLMAINEHIETIGRPVGDVKRMEHELKSLGKMHFSLCESLKKINDACATTIFMYSMRAFIEICAWLLSLNGLLPKLKVDFTMMIVCYVMTMLCIAVSNQMMKNWADKTARTLCEFTATFFHDELGNQRNSILLQMLHQTAHVNIYEMTLSPATIASSVSRISTVITLLLQFRGWSSANK